jgi:5'-nucleotidase
MKRLTTTLALALALLGAPGSARAMDILLTNDDGWLSPGIMALRSALCAAGHHVTMVAATMNQSGRGGSLNTGTDPGSAMALTRQSSDACGVTYSLAPPTGPNSFGGTPVDCVNTGLDVVLANDPPDLVVSGLNFGQNPGKGAPSGSGTVGAAAAAALRTASPGTGIPSIAGSVSINLAEAGSGFASTFAAFAPASEFIVRLIAALEAAPGDALLPQGVLSLNINFPVPYPNITGIKLTRAGNKSDILLPLYDRSVGFPPFPPAGGLSCLSLVDGQSCSVGVAFVPNSGADSERNADVDALRANLISITPMALDPTASGAGQALSAILANLVP